MPDAEEPQAGIETAAETATNFERLAAELPNDSLAAKLLQAWQSELNPAARLKRMLGVAQPVHMQTTDGADATTD